MDDFKDFSRLAQIGLDQRRNKLPLIATNRKTKIKETLKKAVVCWNKKKIVFVREMIRKIIEMA